MNFILLDAFTSHKNIIIYPFQSFANARTETFL